MGKFRSKVVKRVVWQDDVGEITAQLRFSDVGSVGANYYWRRRANNEEVRAEGQSRVINLFVNGKNVTRDQTIEGGQSASELKAGDTVLAKFWGEVMGIGADGHAFVAFTKTDRQAISLTGEVEVVEDSDAAADPNIVLGAIAQVQQEQAIHRKLLEEIRSRIGHIGL